MQINPSSNRPHSELPIANLLELAYMCDCSPREGAIIEIGVFQGGSAWFLNKVADGRAVHLFDTFSGIPEASPLDIVPLGAFANTSAESVQAAIPGSILHVGLFPDTWPKDIGPISFAHIDCDQYLTCKIAIETIWPLMLDGAIMAFDDYPFPGIQKAIHGYFGDNVHFTAKHIPYVVKED